MPDPPSPPTKRHHLPFNMLPKVSKNDGSNNIKKNRLNQVFLTTCVASFLLQLFGAILSLTNMHSSLRPYLLDKHSITDVNTFVETEPIQRQLAVKYDKESNAKLAFGKPPHSGRLRVLVGILSADFFNDQVYRKRHRQLIQLWNDPRVCSLPDFKTRPIAERYQCELIYTFVLGANQDAPPILVDDSRPYEVRRPIKGKSVDLNEPDMTLLNIRENMNEGKSQTWMKYGAEIAEKYDLDYVVKCDADTMLHLHEFFYFAYHHMPPAPYNRGMYIGALRDKAYWPRHETEEERIRFESFFGNNYEGVHLYVAGQIYMLSTDLAKYVGKEALEGNCTYCEGHEDHDISAIAFHSPDPIKLTVIGRSHRFWEHPVKGEPRWKRILAREQARMAGLPFEDRMFTKNSTIEAVLGIQL